MSERTMVHWRPSEKVNWQREGKGSGEIPRSGSKPGITMLLASSQGGGKMRCPLGDSFTVVICNVIVGVNRGQQGYYVDNSRACGKRAALLRVRIGSSEAR
jgi:hypothetical protein